MTVSCTAEISPFLYLPPNTLQHFLEIHTTPKRQISQSQCWSQQICDNSVLFSCLTRFQLLQFGILQWHCMMKHNLIGFSFVSYMSSYLLLYFPNSGSAEIQAVKTTLDFAMHSGLQKKISNTSKQSDKLVLNRKLFLQRKLQISKRKMER